MSESYLSCKVTKIFFEHKRKSVTDVWRLKGIQVVFEKRTNKKTIGPGLHPVLSMAAWSFKNKFLTTMPPYTPALRADHLNKKRYTSQKTFRFAPFNKNHAVKYDGWRQMAEKLLSEQLLCHLI